MQVYKKVIPSWVKYLAQDANGALFGYARQPMATSEFFDGWEGEDFKHVLLAATGKDAPNWRSSLHRYSRKSSKVLKFDDVEIVDDVKRDPTWLIPVIVVIVTTAACVGADLMWRAINYTNEGTIVSLSYESTSRESVEVEIQSGLKTHRISIPADRATSLILGQHYTLEE